jgi:MFS family permease
VVGRSLGRGARRAGRSAKERTVLVLGGRLRTRVIVVLACVLALSSADTATVGAAAIQLRHALHISNTDIGLLVAVTSLVGAALSLPFGVLADRLRRTWLLGASVVLWGIAMVWSATAGNFSDLLLSRLALGGITAVAGPTVASLVGDWFTSGERGRIYSFILSGELLGAGAGFAFTGDIAALSWRLAFVILAIPAFVIAWVVVRLPEPVRGGHGALAPEPGTKPWEAAQREDAARAAAERAAAERDDGRTDAQRLALERGVRPHPDLVRRADPRMGFLTAVRYVLSVRTNVVLVISGALAYYFLAGVQTFGVEFVTGQYHVDQVLANLLLIVVGAGAVVGVLVAGPLGDRLLRRGYLSGRVMVAAVAATFAVGLLIPALLTDSVASALPFIVLAAVGLSAQNPPIDAARLDIMPSWLWGRAEGVRTFLRTLAQALAPLLFGAVSDYIFGGGSRGLRWTFLIMLLPLGLSAFYLFRAARQYPRDVATAAAAPPAPRSPDTPGRAGPAAGPGGGTGGRGLPGGASAGPGGGTGGRGLPGGASAGPGPAVPADAGRHEISRRSPPGPATRWIGGTGRGARRSRS